LDFPKKGLKKSDLDQKWKLYVKLENTVQMENIEKIIDKVVFEIQDENNNL